MTLRNPNANESVEDYDKLQTDAINQNTEGIGAIDKVGSILYRLGLIKDYVVEYGSNTNSNWEKWASGKLVQTKFISVSIPNGTSWQQLYYNDVPMGNWAIPFTSIKYAKENLKNTTYWSNYDGYTITSAGNVRAFRPTLGDANGVSISIYAVGLWK